MSASVAVSPEFNLLSGVTILSETKHTQVIYDIAFDHHRSRVATCSADEHVRVWSLDAGTGKWVLDSVLQPHEGPVWKVTWAHPDIGQVLATCSLDHKRARVFEAEQGDPRGEKWQQRNSFDEYLDSLVTDIKFAPRHLGIILAFASVDGKLLLVGSDKDLKKWHRVAKCEIPFRTLSVIDFSLSTRGKTFLAVGSNEVKANDGKETGNPNHLHIRQIEISKDKSAEMNIITSNLFDAYPVPDKVNACVFAPTAGRSFNLLAVGAKHVIVFKIKKDSSVEEPIELNYPAYVSVNKDCRIWRLCWNLTGTMLVGSTTHGHVFLWQLVNGFVWTKDSFKIVSTNYDSNVPVFSNTTANQNAPNKDPAEGDSLTCL